MSQRERLHRFSKKILKIVKLFSLLSGAYGRAARTVHLCCSPDRGGPALGLSLTITIVTKQDYTFDVGGIGGYFFAGDGVRLDAGDALSASDNAPPIACMLPSTAIANVPAL